MSRPLKYFTILSSTLLIILALIESDAFIKREEIVWENNKTVAWNNFRGNANLLSEFAAAISSYFTYNIEGSTVDSIEVTAFMKAHASWVKKKHLGSSYLLRHEQYHFNISELVARKFRKAILELPSDKLNEKTISRLYRKYRGELGYTQDAYDQETDHSIYIERQLDWEYIVDSLLNDLDIYSVPQLKQYKNVEGQKYYRKLTRNAWHKYEGLYPIDSSIALKTTHYRFYYEGNKVSRIECYNKNIPSIDGDQNIFAKKFIYENGIEYHKYYDKDGLPAMNTVGIYGQKLEGIKNKLIVTNLNKAGLITENVAGIAKIEWKLDHKNRKSIGKIFDSKGNRITDNEGYYTIKYNYDKFDNMVEYANFDENNKRKSLSNGVAFYKYIYDANNNLISVQAFNEKSMLCAFENDIAIIDYRYDLNGNITRRSFKNTKGNLIINERQQAISYLAFDEYGNLLKEANYGLNKNLIISDEKVGCVTRLFDSLGRVIEVNNFDAYKQPLNDTYGKCKSSYNYNEDNLISEEIRYYVDTLFQIQHLKTIKYDYDAESNIVSETWFNEQLELKPDTNGICISKFEYDARNNLSKVCYFNDSSLLQNNSEAVACYCYNYDERSNRIEAAFFNANNEPALKVDSISIEKYGYNDENLLSEIKYFDKNGILTKGDEGVEIIRCKYNSAGYLAEESYFDKQGKICGNTQGVAKYTHLYDAKGNNTQINCYDTDYQLVTFDNSGVAIIKQIFNEQNKLVQTTYLNKNERLKNTPEGFAIQVNKFNDYGFLLRREYYSEYEQPVVSSYGYAAVDIYYDLNFNTVGQVLRDENNDLIADEKGNSIYAFEYNRNGDLIDSKTYEASNINLAKISMGNFATRTIGLNSVAILKSENDNTRVQTTYFQNGQKRSEVMYVDGKLEGKYISYYETGELEGEINYVNGKRDGLLLEFSKNGQKIRELKYENNTYVAGTEKEWYQDGTLRSEYINGEFVEYDPNGNRIVK